MQAYRNFKMKYNSSSGHQSSRSSSLCWRSFRSSNYLVQFNSSFNWLFLFFSVLYSNFTRNRWFHFSTLAVIFYFLTIQSSPPWIPLFQSKALPNETSSTQSLDISLDALLLSSAPTNKPDSDLVDPDGSIKPDNEEDRPYPLKVNGKLKQDPRNVPSSAVTPMPILPGDFENKKPYIVNYSKDAKFASNTNAQWRANLKIWPETSSETEL